MNAVEVLLIKIRTIDDATALEAAQLLSVALDAEPASDVASPVILSPLEHRREVAEMCRLLLTIAATDPQTRELAAESIAGAGRKHLVLGGMEIVALAALALGALQVCLSRGRQAEESVMTIERQADGTEVTTIRKTVKYGLSSQIGQLVRSTLGLQASGDGQELVGE